MSGGVGTLLMLLDVVLPVFLVIGAGYGVARAGLMSASAIDALNHFAQRIAIPCLLFRAVAQLDLAQAFDWRLLVSFYAGAASCFALGVIGARLLFGRRPGEAVAIGFGALFSNSVLLGLPITERAFGADALGPNYAILSIHAPFCYLLGISTMEMVRADGRGLLASFAVIWRTLRKNALMIGIACGFAVNLTGLALPGVAWDALDMVVRAALPTALIGLGGVLTRYHIREQLGPVAMVGALSLMLHPAIAYGVSVGLFALPDALVRSLVLTAAMAPGVNTFIFATMYQRAQDVAASVVLVCTMVSVVSVSLWLSILI